MMSESTSFVDSSRLGVAVLSGFAVIWAAAAAGLSSLSLAVTIPIAGAVLVVAIIVNVLAATRDFAPTDEERAPMTAQKRRTIFIVSNIAQAVLFSVLISVCIALQQLAHIPLLGSIIVGAHLIPIGYSFAERTFIASGAILILTGALGLAAAWIDLSTPELAAGVVSLANAAVLVTVAGVMAFRYGSRRPVPHT